MIVYRIEWPEGGGFYNGRSYSFAMSLIDDTNDAIDRHPSPSNDSLFAEDYRRKLGPLDNALDLRWAFESLRSLRRWFYNDQWIRNIDEAGGLLCTYEVNPHTTIVGRTQVAFDSKTAKLFYREPLINVLEKV